MVNLNVIVAAASNRGIGINGDLPWRLRKEIMHFARMTKRVSDNSKTSAVIMGRKTWESIPEKRRPLKDRINVVLSKSQKEMHPEVHVSESLASAIKHLEELSNVENAWVIGGASVYKEVINSDRCHRIYLTEVKKDFECDTFLCDITDSYEEITDPDVPVGEQEEDNISYVYKVYQKKK